MRTLSYATLLAALSLTLFLPPASAAPGSLDPTFGTGGMLRVHLGELANSGVRASAIQVDGKMVVLGNSVIAAGSSLENSFAVVRYNTDGTLDASFGIGGKARLTSTLGNSLGSATAIAIQPSGKIVIAGDAFDSSQHFLLARFNSDGTLDTSFGSNGVVNATVNLYSDPTAIAVQPDGKIVVAGEATSVACVVRFNVNGALDATFGSNGIVMLDFPYGSATSVLVQPDGAIVVGRQSYNSGNSGFRAMVVRLTPGGAADSTFNGNGQAFVTLGTTSDTFGPVYVALQADGKLVVGGTGKSAIQADYSVMAIARLNSNGSLDASFGEGGQFAATLPGTNGAGPRMSSLAIRPDGAIVAAGNLGASTAGQVAVVRLTSAGVLDTAWAGTGVARVAFDVPAAAYSLVVQADGKVVAAGEVTLDGLRRFALARLDAAGVPDSGFGIVGIVTTTFAASSDFGVAMVRLADDRLIVVGTSRSDASGWQLTLSRYLPDGALDQTFGTAGVVAAPIPEWQGKLAAALQANGGIVVAGSAQAATGITSVVVTRRAADGTLDPAFGNAGYATIDFGGATRALAIVVQSDQKILVADTGMSVARLKPDGSLDTTFNGTGRAVAVIGGGKATASAIALQPDAKIVVAGTRAIVDPQGNGSNQPVVVRYNADGTQDKVFAASGATVERVGAVAVDPGGKILVGASYSAPPFSGAAAIVRFKPNGDLDGSFGDGGIARDPGHEGVNALAFQSTGKILATAGNFEVRRHFDDGSVDFSFSSPFITNGIFDGLRAMVVQSSGKIILGGLLLDNQGTDRLLMRLDTGDTSPASFQFTAQSGVVPGSVRISNTVTIANIAAPVAISVVGGEYSIGCNATFTASAGTIGDKQTVCVRHVASAATFTTTTTTLVVGGISATFTSTTGDTSPSQFQFTTLYDVILSSVQVSDTVTIRNLPAPAPISVTNGEYSIGCTTSFTAIAGTISDGQTVCVRHTAAASQFTPTVTTLTVGVISANFISITNGTSIVFATQYLVPLGSLRTSNAVTIANLAAPAAISVVGGEYSIGCNEPFTTAPGTISNGQTVCVRHVASALLFTSTTTTLTVGVISSTFVSITISGVRDVDGDGVPDEVEVIEGLNPGVKDNDIFAATTKGARLFAMQQYRDFLNREGDVGGIAFWQNYVATGGTRAAVVESFILSNEFQGVISPVVRLYFAFFLRIPDYGGLQFWIDYYRAGNALSDIADKFAGSNEFVSRYGALANGQFVDLVYQNVLGRNPDPAGRAFWLAQLDAGMSRGTMMIGFSESAENMNNMRADVEVTMAYVGTLRRSPDPVGFAFWTQFLEYGNSFQTLINAFLGVPEYHDRFLP